METRVRFNHLGHTVADIARARRFYEGLLGFRFWWDFEVPDELSSRLLMVPPPVQLTATYLWHPDLVLNLMHFGAKGARRQFQKRQLNEPGFTHIALSVEDHAGVLARVPEFGGDLIPESMGPPSEWGTAVFIRDPDGQLIELVTMGWREKLPLPPSNPARGLGVTDRQGGWAHPTHRSTDDEKSDLWRKSVEDDHPKLSCVYAEPTESTRRWRGHGPL